MFKPDATVTADDRRAAGIRNAIREELETEQPVYTAMHAYVNAAAQHRDDFLRNARTTASKSASTRQERRARVAAAFTDAFAELDSELLKVAVQRDQSQQPGEESAGRPPLLPHETAIRTTVSTAAVPGVREEALQAAAKSGCKMAFDFVAVPQTMDDLRREVRVQLEGSEFEGARVPISLKDLFESSSDSGDDGGHFGALNMSVFKFRVKPTASNEQVGSLIKALRRAEKELPERDSGTSADAFVDFKLERDAASDERFVVVTGCTRTMDPSVEFAMNSVLAPAFAADGHTAVGRRATGRIELPMTLSEWLASDLSYPALLNRMAVTGELVTSRANADRFLGLIFSMLIEDSAAGAASVLSNLAWSRLLSAVDVGVTINPMSLACGRAMRVLATVFRSCASFPLLDGQHVQLGEMLKSTALPEWWGRCAATTAALVTGSALRDNAVANAVLGYVNENRHNDELEEEQLRIVPVLFDAGAVLDELASATFFNPLGRVDMKASGVDPWAAFPKSYGAAVVNTRQMILASMGSKQQLGTGGDGNDEPDSSDEESIETATRVDFEQDAEDFMMRRPGAEDVERASWKAMGLQPSRMMIHEAAVPQQKFRETTFLRIAVLIPSWTDAELCKAIHHADLYESLGVPTSCLRNLSGFDAVRRAPVDGDHTRVMPVSGEFVLDGKRVVLIVHLDPNVVAAAQAVIVVHPARFKVEPAHPITSTAPLIVAGDAGDGAWIARAYEKPNIAATTDDLKAAIALAIQAVPTEAISAASAVPASFPMDF